MATPSDERRSSPASLDRGDAARAVLVIPARFGDATRRPAVRPPCRSSINGDNANTATTVMGYATGLVSARVAALRGAGAGRHRRVRAAADARARGSGHNPELRSTLFLVPGLIAYIAMLTAVVSTAPLGRARERGRARWSRSAWRRSGPCPTSSGKTAPYFVISLVSSHGIVVGCDAALRPADARLVAGARRLSCRSSSSGRSAFGLLISTHRRPSAGGVSDCAPDARSSRR